MVRTYQWYSSHTNGTMVLEYHGTMVLEYHGATTGPVQYHLGHVPVWYCQYHWYQLASQVVHVYVQI